MSRLPDAPHIQTNARRMGYVLGSLIKLHGLSQPQLEESLGYFKGKIEKWVYGGIPDSSLELLIEDIGQRARQLHNSGPSRQALCLSRLKRDLIRGNSIQHLLSTNLDLQLEWDEPAETRSDPRVQWISSAEQDPSWLEEKIGKFSVDCLNGDFGLFVNGFTAWKQAAYSRTNLPLTVRLAGSLPEIASVYEQHDSAILAADHQLFASASRHFQQTERKYLQMTALRQRAVAYMQSNQITPMKTEHLYLEALEYANDLGSKIEAIEAQSAVMAELVRMYCKASLLKDAPTGTLVSRLQGFKNDRGVALIDRLKASVDKIGDARGQVPCLYFDSYVRAQVLILHAADREAAGSLIAKRRYLSLVESLREPLRSTQITNTHRLWDRQLDCFVHTSEGEFEQCQRNAEAGKNEALSQGLTFASSIFDRIIRNNNSMAGPPLRDTAWN
jgi:hypothetical protein